MVPSENEGVPYLVLNGKPWNWVTKVFKHRVEVDSRGEVFFTLDQTNYQHASEQFAEFFEREVWLQPKAGLGKALIPFSVLFLPKTLCGFNLWWSATCISTWAVLPKTETLGAALHNNRWESMKRLATKRGLDGRCLRKPAVTAHAKLTAAEARNSERVWLMPSFATHFLMSVLAQWAFAANGCGGLADVDRKDACKDALTSIIQVIVGKECFILVAPDAEWDPPRKPHSVNGIFLDGSSGKLDLSSILKAFPEWQGPKQCSKNPDCVPDEFGKVDIVALLQAAEKAGAKAQTFLNQLIWGLGEAIENRLVADLVHQAEQNGNNQRSSQKAIIASNSAILDIEIDPGAPSPEVAHTSAEPGKMSNKTLLRKRARDPDPAYRVNTEPKQLDAGSHEMMQFLDAYARSARVSFRNELQLSISIDGSRVAKKALLLAAMAKPTGEAAWAPPQVSDDYDGESALSILDCANEDQLQDAKQVQFV